MRPVVFATAAVALFAVAAAPASARAFDPSALSGVGDSEQVIVVTASSWGTSHASVRAYERAGDGTWSPVVTATPARIGYSGMTPGKSRRQGTGKTPVGTFGIVTTFGRLAKPKTEMPYVRFDRNDAWTYNPKSPSTYNVFQTASRSWRSFGGYVERLWRFGEQYNYVAVLDYNLPTGPITASADGIRRSSDPADTSMGGGIFLHVTNGTATAGCIAIPQATMGHIMRWLDPSKHPVIAILPPS